MSLSILNSQDAKLNAVVGPMLQAINSMTAKEALAFYSQVAEIGSFGHEYSFLNKMLIHRQGGTLVAGFKAWAAYNRVPKGSGTAIIISSPWIKTGKKTVNGQEQTYTYLAGYGHCNVFDIKNTVILDPSKPDGVQVWKEKFQNISKRGLSADLDLVAVIQGLLKNNIAVSQELLEPNLGGYAQQGKIVLNSLFAAGEQYATLIHECAHIAAGHCDPACNLSTAQKECEVELVTALMLQKLGADSQFSLGYISNWSSRSAVTVDALKIAAIMTKVEKLLTLN